MLTELKREAYEANLALPKHGLVYLNFGNASALDPGKGIFAIKPSGVDYDMLKPSQMVLVDLDGNIVEGSHRPSSDTPTHRIVYRGLPQARGVVHTHSAHATAFSQAGKPIPAFGTTHADFFEGPVPITRSLTPSEIKSEYEANTGLAILEAVKGLHMEGTGAALVLWHAPFAWGDSVGKAVEMAVALEFCAKLALETLRLSPSRKAMPDVLHRKHFFRKHGPDAYYGQPKKN